MTKCVDDNYMTPSTKKLGWRIPDSIFLKCLSVFAASSLLTMAMLTYKSIQTMGTISTVLSLQIGTEVAKQLAQQTAGVIKFERNESIREILGRAVAELNGKASGALVVDTKGEIVGEATVGNPINIKVLELANAAMSIGEEVRHPGLLIVAQPIFFGEEKQLVGAIALDLSAEGTTAIVAQEKKIAILLGLGISISTLIFASLYLRRVVARPLIAIASAMKHVQDGNYDIEIPKYRRGNEVGIVVRSLEQFRDQLRASEGTRRDALMKSAALDAGSAAIMIADADLKVVYASQAVLDVLREHQNVIETRIPNFDPDHVVGQSIDVFQKETEMQWGMLSGLDDTGHNTNLEMDDVTLELKISKIDNAVGERIGYVVEWADVSRRRLNSAILNSLDENQARAEFNKHGELADCNEAFRMLAKLEATNATCTFQSTVFVNEAPANSEKPMFGEIEIRSKNGVVSHALGGLSPIFYQNGSLKRTVLIAADVTNDTKRKREAEADRERLQSEQSAMIDALKEALMHLSVGDLNVRIEEMFAGGNDQLRQDFNTAIGNLEQAIEAVVEGSKTIHAEVSGVAGAANEMSNRTESQAATLEQTAAAINQVTASVSSSADNAQQTNELASAARSTATMSERIVSDAVASMGKISQSSNEIASIVKVIDDIAFQTNLLALNAGVEAARAGDAGRGFAVVAYEVRTLAQRSAEAARKIGNLISISSENVEDGVELVGRAGTALENIISSINEISENVSSIACAAREQSQSIAEVNSAMSELDKVTQENAAMFEETAAATQNLTQLANNLSKSVEKFSTKSTQTSNLRNVVFMPTNTASGLVEKHKSELVAGGNSTFTEDWK